MASAVLQTQPLRFSPLPTPNSTSSAKPIMASFKRTSSKKSFRVTSYSSRRFSPLRFVTFVPFASGEMDTAQTQEEEESAKQPEIQDPTDGAVGAGDDVSNDGVHNEIDDGAEDASASAVLSSLQLYKEALQNNDEVKIAEIEDFLKSLEDEKIELEKKLNALSEESSVDKDRILRISADFDNFRKRTERDRLSLVENAQGEVLEKLLSVLDNFERAKAQIKVATEGEEKISNSYQSIYKQFLEVLGSLGIVPVETVGNVFDPMLHEAIMRDESTEFDEGVVIEEFRKGFKLGDRLLRPSMVKVSAGPGPAKPEQGPSEEVGESEEPKSGSEAGGDESSEAETS